MTTTGYQKVSNQLLDTLSMNEQKLTIAFVKITSDGLIEWFLCLSFMCVFQSIKNGDERVGE